MEQLKRILRDDRKAFALLAILIFLPLFFYNWYKYTIHPAIKGGDEPHYMVMIHSLLNDGDFDLKNNYLNAFKGSWDAGLRFRRYTLDPHAGFYMDGHYIGYRDIYEDVPGQYVKAEEDDFKFPVPKPGVDPRYLEAPWFPGHPCGVAFILYPFLLPFRGTNFIESASIVYSALAVILAAWFFRRILDRHFPDPYTANRIMFLAFLGSPIWPHARMVFNESFLLFFAMGAYYFALRKNSGLLAGIMIGLSILLKPVFALLAIPLFLFWAIRKELLNAALLSLGCILFAAGFIFSTYWIYGTFVYHTSFRFGNPLFGILGLLFNWSHGLLSFSPVAAFAIFYWKSFLRQKHAGVFLGGFALYFLLMASWWCWWGGWCYGPRLIVPVIPFLMIPLGLALQSYHLWSPWKQRLFLACCILSLIFNFMGTSGGYWDSHPLTILLGRTG